MLQEKIYKLPQPSLRKVVQHIIQSNPSVKYTKNLNGYFFNMSFIDDNTLSQVFEIVCSCETKPSSDAAKEN